MANARYGNSSFYYNLRLHDDEKEKDKFIKDIERIIRTSLEYKNYIKFLKTEALLKYCSLLNKMPEEITAKLSLEMHHYPFGLYDLVNIILSKHLIERIEFSRLTIANEVMDLHYNIQIGIVPLTVTMHELAHSNSIKLSSDMIFGDYHAFMQEYVEYIPEDKKLEISNMEQKSLFNKDYYAKINSVTLDINPSIFSDDEDEDLSTKEIDEFFDDGNS